MSYDQTITKTITIHAPASKVWAALTDVQLMKQWMYEGDIDIVTGWRVGGDFLISGKLHGVKFTTFGKVLAFETERLLSYSHRSSISRLPDVPASYSIVEFALSATGNLTVIDLTLSNFPTETIYKHLSFYWNGTLAVLKRFVEKA